MKGYIRWFATLVTFFIAWIAFSTMVPLLLILPLQANIGPIELLLFTAVGLIPVFFMARKMYRHPRWEQQR